MNHSERLKEIYERLPSIPMEPGCYLWQRSKPDSQEKEVLYVGKAINLRNRIRQYFTSNDYKTIHLMSKVTDLEYIITQNELEALLLENNMIKEYSPVYNIRLKDDKRYPYLCLTMGEAFPRLIMTRRKTNPKHVYYGPYSDVVAARNIMNLILKIFPIRKRNQSLPAKTPQRPCLNYHIGLCLAPCAAKISQEDYGVMIQKIKSFLDSRNEQVLVDLEKSMADYSKKMEYEKAAIYRNIISDVKAIYESQSVHEEDDENNYDVVGLHEMSKSEAAESLDISFDSYDENLVFAQIVLLRIRKGNLINKSSYALSESTAPQETDAADFRSELIETFFREYYLNLTDVPGLILANSAISAKPEWEKIFLDKFHTKVKIIDNANDPEYNKRVSLISMAENNARLTLRERLLSEKIRNQRYGLRQIQKFLHMNKLPEIIECYDISNIQGTNAVGCGVMLKNGIPYKAGYRRYKITTKDTPDDPAMMYEVISRRMRAFEEKTAEVPDLMIIDGGITQIHAALRAREEIGISVKIISLAKKEETIFLDDDSTIQMDKNSPGMLIIRLARDEAHRFSVAYHRELRSKKNFQSMIDDIAGIGPIKKNKILSAIQKFQDGDLTSEKINEIIAGVPGLTEVQTDLIIGKFKDLIQA